MSDGAAVGATGRVARIARGALAIALFSAALWYGAFWMQNYTPQRRWLRLAMRSEAFHVTAHLVLYGALYALCRALFAALGRAGVALAVAVTLVVAFVQETVQVVTYRGRFGAGEAFDIVVDCVAIAIVSALLRWRRKK